MPSTGRSLAHRVIDLILFFATSFVLIAFFQNMWRDTLIYANQQIGTDSIASQEIVFVKITESFLDSELPMAMQFDAWAVLLKLIAHNAPNAILVDYHFGSRRFEKLLPGAASRFEQAVIDVSRQTILVLGVPAIETSSKRPIDTLANLQSAPNIRHGCMLFVKDSDEVIRDMQSTFFKECPTKAELSIAATVAKELGISARSTGLVLAPQKPNVNIIEASAIIRREISLDFLRGKIVTIGSGFPSEDEHLSSHYSNGIIFHAPAKGAVIHGLHTVALLEERVAWNVQNNIFTAALFYSCVMLSLLTILLRRLASIPLCLAGALMLIEFASTIFFKLHLAIFPVSCFLIAASTIVQMRKTLQDLLIKQKIQRLLGGLLSPMVLKHCMKNPMGLLNPCRYVDAAVLVIDIEGYTHSAEQMETGKIYQLSNEFLGFCTRIIHQHGGCVERFRGDGLLAYFGAPVPSNQSCEQALGAALQILLEINENTQPNLAYFKHRIRIGVSHGEIILGQVGDRDRFDIGVTGRAANRASHFESMADSSAFPIVIDTQSLEKCTTQYATQQLMLRHPKHPGTPLHGIKYK